MVVSGVNLRLRERIMLNIVVVEPGQFADMMGNLPREKRFVLPEFPATNLYLTEMRTLVVIKDDGFQSGISEGRASIHGFGCA